jgi:hypothetical protein
MAHLYDCIRCNKRKTKKKLLKIKIQWLKDFFASVGKDFFNRSICLDCYFYLSKSKKQNKIFSEHANMLKTVFKNKPAYNNQYFDQISEETTIDLIGITKIQFIDMFESSNPNEWLHTVDYKNCLGFFLARLRLGLSVKKLLSLIPLAPYKNLLKIINEVRSILDGFVNENLGFSHLTRGINLFKFKY